jgi:hypothetical protein
MKKLTTSLLAAIGLLAAVPASASAISYTSAVTATTSAYEKTLTFDIANHAFNGVGVLDWTFLFDPSFSLPGSSIATAKLYVSARQATGGDDIVSVNNTAMGALAAGAGNNPIETEYDLYSLFHTGATWSATNQLSLAMKLSYDAPGSPANKALSLEYARVALTFADIGGGAGGGGGGSNAVPEPGTAALLGLGLAGALLAQRRQRRQQRLSAAKRG